ncbi:uncharacterized protein LOC109861474 [Pseudomyrmex gracilis]|uniref:uncharacterized protein LOC109861474 n=1 Tax=Pseudomyrmex gracilis TaxID=219809 RepID=UPI00099497DE|nr:uncharacterized protein LOC109861474 [Pseudomyrmex gracilis]
MQFVSNDSTFTRKNTRSNVYKAIELVKKRVEKKRNRNEREVANRAKIAHYCKSFEGDKKKTLVTGFSKSLALSEMQSYIARQDWKHATHLFPKLLEYPVELEPLVWRYLLIILLHTNDSSHLRQFVKQCIGNQSSSNNLLLQRLLLLPLEN